MNKWIKYKTDNKNDLILVYLFSVADDNCVSFNLHMRKYSPILQSLPFVLLQGFVVGRSGIYTP